MVIDVRDLCIDQGAFQLRNVGFQLAVGEYGVLMGKSGCGKTTIMEAICGLRRVASGSIGLAGRDVTKLRPGDRNIGYVPQDGALFPTMSVFEQVAFGLRVRRVESSRVKKRVQHVSETLGIEHLLDRKPRSLSGGETQRVAIGRALAVEPAILCLDEPLSALDEDTREEIIGLLKRLRADSPVTTLHITHQRSEASDLADKLFTLENGQITPAAISR